MRTCNSVNQNRCRMQRRCVIRGSSSAASLGESSPLHSISLSQWFSTGSEKRPRKWADLCEAKEGTINEFFDLRFAATVNFHGLYRGKLDIVKVLHKTRIWNKLEAIWLFQTKTIPWVPDQNSGNHRVLVRKWNGKLNTSHFCTWNRVLSKW